MMFVVVGFPEIVAKGITDYVDEPNYEYCQKRLKN